MTKAHLKAVFLAAALLAPLSQTAQAGGSFGVTISAEGGRERAAISRFLRYYSAGQAAAEVIQRGQGNAASVAQSGDDHRAVVSQRGSGHSAHVTQRGRGHRLGVFQFGQGTRADVAQTGQNGAALVFLGGW